MPISTVKIFLIFVNTLRKGKLLKILDELYFERRRVCKSDVQLFNMCVIQLSLTDNRLP